MSFQYWIKTLDRMLIRAIGVGAYSLADQPYSLRDRFDAGETPREVAAEITNNPMEYL